MWPISYASTRRLRDRGRLNNSRALEESLQQRVVITGMGMVTCLGSGVEANWDALQAGRSGIGPITLFDVDGLATRIAGEVHGDFDPAGHIPTKELRRMDRYQQFALVAAGEAFAQSGLHSPPEDPYRCGVIIGSGIGGLATIEAGVGIDNETRGRERFIL